MYGIGQVLWPSQFPAIYTVDKGGLLQNGNHLSFICCLAFLGIPILAKEAKEQWARILLFFSCAILLCGIIIGRGRLPWISLGTVLFLFVMWALRVSTEPIYRWLKVQHIFWGIILALSCVVALRISGAWVESDFFNIFSEIPKTVRTEGWTKLLFVGGRGPHFLVAADALAQNPYFGIGIDSFFAKTTLSLSIHSLFFQWIVGLGLVGSIAWFFTLSISAMSAIRCIIRMKRLNISLTISMLSLLFMAMTHLGDVFAAYRSMFAFCSLVSTAFWLELQPHSKEKDSPFICSLVLISVSSSILALLSWNSPQSIPLYSFHRSEHDQAKTFTWNGLFRHVFLPPGICTRFEVSTPIRRQGQILKAAFVPEGSEPPSFVNRVQLANWESLHNVKPATSLQSGQWIPICTCAPYNEIGTLYLSSKYGEILSASREEFGYDDRFIGFGVANPLTFDRSDGNLSQFCKDAITLLPN